MEREREREKVFYQEVKTAWRTILLQSREAWLNDGWGKQNMLQEFN